MIGMDERRGGGADNTELRDGETPAADDRQWGKPIDGF